MFYTKYGGKRKVITSRNVYTRCPECGREYQIDLAETIQPGQFDFEATRVLCADCSMRKTNGAEKP